MKIAVVGSYGAGLTMRVPRIPLAGETLTGGVFASGHGGKGSNQAVAAARLGADVTFLSAIGGDAFGDDARRLWADERVDASHVKVVENAATMVGVILVEADGENRIVIAPGALDQLTSADVDAFAGPISEADLVVVSLEIPVPVAVAVLRTAHDLGVRTLLNPAPAVALPDDVWSWIDVVTPNESEAQALVGRERRDDVDTGDLIDDLRKKTAAAIVLTVGAQGAVVDDGERRMRVAPVAAPAVVDTTGAGDAFTGALAVALASGDELAAAVGYASAAGAFAVGIAEVIPALPSPADVAALMAVTS